MQDPGRHPTEWRRHERRLRDVEPGSPQWLEAAVRFRDSRAAHFQSSLVGRSWERPWDEFEDHLTELETLGPRRG